MQSGLSARCALACTGAWARWVMSRCVPGPPSLRAWSRHGATVIAAITVMAVTRAHIIVLVIMAMMMTVVMMMVVATMMMMMMMMIMMVTSPPR